MKLHWIFLICFSYLILLTVASNTPEISADNLHFGAEYGNIAEAMASKKGFSNPFGTESGPTAWMPPLLPLLMLALFKIFGIKTLLAAWALLLIKTLALAHTGVLLYTIASREKPSRSALLILPIYLSLLTTHHWIFFQAMHDIWLLPWFGTMVLNSFHASDKNKTQPKLRLGILGGLTALIHPVLGFAFAILTLNPLNHLTWKRRIIIGLISLLTISPWVARNYITFGQIILLKSNVFYDAYQGNYLDDDGILTHETFETFHPIAQNTYQEQYTREGEKHFMERHKDLFIEALKNDPATYLKKCAYRLLTTTLYPAEILQRKNTSTPYKAVKWILYISPFLILILWLIKGRPKHHALIIPTLIYIAAYLLPFILVGFYFRYRAPLIPAFTLIIYAGLLASLSKKRSIRPQ